MTFIYILANRALALPEKKFDELMLSIWTFYITQSFLSLDPFGLWSLEYPGIQGLGLRGHACE